MADQQGAIATAMAGGTRTVRYTGRADAGVFDSLRAQGLAMLAQMQPAAFMLDMRGFTPAWECARFAEIPDELRVAALPAAMVVPEGQASLWRAYSLAAADQGVIRAVFHREEDALDWCARMKETAPGR